MAKTDAIVEQHEGLTIGASEIASAAGMDPWRTPLELYLDKLHGRPDRSSEAMEWGLNNEYHILQIHAKRMGTYVLGQDLNEEPCLYRPDGRPVWSSQGVFKRRVSSELLGLLTETCVHPDHPVLTCHPDGFELDGSNVTGIVQAKNMSAWVKLGDELPVNYQLQAHHEVTVLEDLLGHSLTHQTPIFKGGSGWHLFETVRDPEISEMIFAIAAEMVLRVKNGDAPDPTEDARGAADLARLYFGEKGKGMLIGEGSVFIEVMDRMREVTDEMKELEEEKEALGVRIREKMGEHTSANDLDKSMRVTWGEQKVKTTVRWKAVAEELWEALTDMAAMGVVDGSMFDELKLKHTKLSDPFRTFRTTFK